MNDGNTQVWTLDEFIAALNAPDWLVEWIASLENE